MSDHTIDDDYIESIVNSELSQAESWMDSDLAQEQADNLKYYYGEPFGNEEEGFSTVVTRDVLETVEGIMPDLMKIFTAGDDVVAFDPIGPGDEQRVELEGKYINHVFMNRFDGYKLLYDWFKDALLMKNGLIKTGWDATMQVQFRWYEDLTQEEFDLLQDGQSEDDALSDMEWEVDSYLKNDDDTYNVRIKTSIMRGRPDICVIPSEEFRIKERSKSIKDASFVAHVTEKTVGELLELGYDEDDIDSAISTVDNGVVKDARFSQPDESGIYGEEIQGNKYERLVEVSESWVKLYDEQDGECKLYRTFSAGRKLLDYEEVDRCPIISLSPIMIPHKYAGMAVADLVRDIQEIRSTIMRQMLDNLALQNAGRWTAVEGQVNLQDLIDNKIGGIVRQKMPGAVQRLDTPDLSQFTIPVMQDLEIQKENRTGVSRMTQGLDDKTLNSHQTVGAVTQMMTAAQQKIQLIARNFAETGVKELFLELYNLIREHQTMPDILPVQGRFAIINPAEWIDRYDVHVTVGIGRGNKDQQLMHLNNINMMLQNIKQSSDGYLVTTQNVYNMAAETIKNSGYDNPEKFISNPSTVEPPEPPPNVELMNAETARMQVQSKAENDKADTMLEQMKFEWEKKVNAAEVSMEATQKRPVGVGTGK